MPPIDFEKLANPAFDVIKNTVGTKATYLPKAGGLIEVRGPFDDRAQEVDPDTERVVSSNIYTFGLKLDDIPSPPVKGDRLIINTIEYIVINANEDGVPGVSTVLIMHRSKGAL